MPMFKTNPISGGSSQLTVIAGSATVTGSGSQPINTVVTQALQNPAPNLAGAAPGPTSLLNPLGSQVIAVVNPTPAYKPQVATGGSAAVMLLDMQSFPGNIVSVTVATKGSPSGTPGALSTQITSGVVYDIDNVNKYIYCGIVGAGGTSLNWQSGMTLYFTVVVSDTFAI